MAAVLQVATPEGACGRILTSGTDNLFRYHEGAKAQATELSNRSKSFDVRLFAMPGLPKVVVGLYSEPGASFADAGQL